MQILDHIRKFADITPAVEESLRAVIREKHFSKGDTIRGAVNLTSYAHYITSGSARLFYTHKSKEHTVSFSFENEFIVISRHVVMNLPDTVSIQFLEPTTVLTMPHLKVKDILDDVGKVSDTAGLLFLSTALMQYVAFLEERVSVMQRWVLKSDINGFCTVIPASPNAPMPHKSHLISELPKKRFTV